MCSSDLVPEVAVDGVSPVVPAEKVLTPPPANDHVPGVPAVIQIQILPVWSITKSPTANVPVTGAPEVVAPTYRDAAVAPVNPEAEYSGAVVVPVKVAEDMLGEEMDGDVAKTGIPVPVPDVHAKPVRLERRTWFVAVDLGIMSTQTEPFQYFNSPLTEVVSYQI